MVSVNQALICGFLVVLYLTLRKFWDSTTSLTALLSCVFIFLYSYDYYRYMIHTTLMVTVSALTLWVLLNLFAKARVSDYCLLGFLMAMGILAKYNFVFFAAVVLLSCLGSRIGRRRLFNHKTWYFLVFMLVPLAPHCIWLYEHDWTPIHYALNRGESGTLGNNILSVILDFIWQPLVYVAIIAVFFGREISITPRNKYLFGFVRQSALYAYLVPMLAIIILQIGNFSQRWLAPVNFLLPLICFSYISLKNKHRVFQSVCVSIILAIYILKITAFYFPDIYKKSIFIHRPHKALYANLDETLRSNGHIKNDISEAKILVYGDLLILAGIKSLNPKVQIEMASQSNLQDKVKQADLLLWDASLNDPELDKLAPSSSITKISAPYLRSKKNLQYSINSLWL